MRLFSSPATRTNSIGLSFRPFEIFAVYLICDQASVCTLFIFMFKCIVPRFCKTGQAPQMLQKTRAEHSQNQILGQSRWASPHCAVLIPQAEEVWLNMDEWHLRMDWIILKTTLQKLLSPALLFYKWLNLPFGDALDPHLGHFLKFPFNGRDIHVLIASMHLHTRHHRIIAKRLW